MVIDFKKYVEKREEDRARIKAEAELAEARIRLAEAYVVKGLSEIFERRGMGKLSDEAVEAFTPLMLSAIDQGLTAAEIENLILESIEEVQDDA